MWEFNREIQKNPFISMFLAFLVIIHTGMKVIYPSITFLDSNIISIFISVTLGVHINLSYFATSNGVIKSFSKLSFYFFHK